MFHVLKVLATIPYYSLPVRNEYMYVPLVSRGYLEKHLIISALNVVPVCCLPHIQLMYPECSALRKWNQQVNVEDLCRTTRNAMQCWGGYHQWNYLEVFQRVSFSAVLGWKLQCTKNVLTFKAPGANMINVQALPMGKTNVKPGVSK